MDPAPVALVVQVAVETVVLTLYSRPGPVVQTQVAVVEVALTMRYLL
jgi:hypothetical protein